MYLLPRRRLGYGAAPESFYGKPQQKKVAISSEANRRIIDRGVSDLAAIADTSSSAIIEGVLIDRLMPENEKARKYYSAVLFGEKYPITNGHPTRYDIQDALEDIFYNEACGDGYMSAHKGTGRYIVEYLYKILQEHRICLKEDSNNGWGLYEVHESWDSICRRLKYLIEDNAQSGIRDYCVTEAAMQSRQIEHKIKENPHYPLSETIQFLLQCWNSIGSSTHTWRYLSFIMKASESWNSTPEERLEFKDVCQATFSEWDAVDIEEAESEQRKMEAAELIPYTMKDGATAMVPRGWMVINPEDALNSHYAGVIEVLNGEAFDTPHFLFFVENKNPKSLTEQERLALYQKTISIWPRFKDVLNAEVDLEYGPDGGVLNRREWVLAPSVGIFSIYDEGTYPYGKHPYGAHIKRQKGGIE